MKAFLLVFLVSVMSQSLFSQSGWYEVDIPIEDNHHGAVYAIDENTVHVVIDDGIFFKSTDGGESWSIFESGIEEHFFDLAFNHLNVGIAVGANGSLLRSTDGGNTWTIVNSGTSAHLFSLDFVTETEVWAVGSETTMLRSFDSGATWQQVGETSPRNFYSIQFKNSNIGLIAGENGYLLKTLDGGENWEFVDTGASNDLFSISITENNYFVGIGVANHGYQLNFEHFTEQLVSENLMDWEFIYYEVPYPPSAIYFYDDNTGFALWSEACLCYECYLQIYKSEDLGENWDLRLDITTYAPVYCIASGYFADMNFVSPLAGYVLYGENLFKTTDGGTHTVVGIEDQLSENPITLFPNPTDGFLYVSGKNLQETIIAIFDVYGVEIFWSSIKNPNTPIDISSLNTGIYFAKITDATGQIAVEKIIKK